MNQYSGIEKKLDAVASAVKSLDKTSKEVARKQGIDHAHTPFDVDQLTSSEIAVLKQLIEHDGDLQNYSTGQIKSGGAKVVGMYSEFDRYGLVSTSFNGECAYVLPMGYWAVEKHEQRLLDAELEKKSQWRHDAVVASVSTAIGGVLGILGTLLGVLLG